MNEILRVKPLVFTAVCEAGESDYYVAHTPTGVSYEYSREGENIEVRYCVDGDGEPLVIVGNAVAAQQVCNMDYTNRIMESLVFGGRK